MRLSQLIRDQKEAILQEFEDFARTHTAPGTTMDVEALRDHAAGMLTDMAADLEQPQSDSEQERKGKGDAEIVAGSPRTAAEHHGLGRAESGFSMEETFAEYRALRASVMRHYVTANGHGQGSDVQDVIRFNEAIDQALAESITEYAQAVNRYRDLSLAVLGHDLRSPLDAIANASAVLSEHSDLSERDGRLAKTIANTAATMNRLVNDLLQYTSEELGEGMTLRRSSTDLGELAADIVREVETSRPEAEIRLETEGSLEGNWDPGRVRQALSNLVTNAVWHAAADSAVRVVVAPDAEADAVVATVHNHGEPIPREEQDVIFQPFKRGAESGESRGTHGGGMGLGLYITRRMAEAHGGSVHVESSREEGTTFELRLPRQAAAESPTIRKFVGSGSTTEEAR